MSRFRLPNVQKGHAGIIAPLQINRLLHQKARTQMNIILAEGGLSGLARHGNFFVRTKLIQAE